MPVLRGILPLPHPPAPVPRAEYPMLIILFCLALNDSVILKACYTQVPGTDVEYGQGAIERCEVHHREIAPSVWLIAVDPPGDVAEWQTKLNANVDPKHGRFAVACAAEEEVEAVRSGKITLQR
jgi:hypothetical protein